MTHTTNHEKRLSAALICYSISLVFGIAHTIGFGCFLSAFWKEVGNPGLYILACATACIAFLYPVCGIMLIANQRKPETSESASRNRAFYQQTIYLSVLLLLCVFAGVCSGVIGIATNDSVKLSVGYCFLISAFPTDIAANILLLVSACNIKHIEVKNSDIPATKQPPTAPTVPQTPIVNEPQPEIRCDTEMRVFPSPTVKPQYFSAWEMQLNHVSSDILKKPFLKQAKSESRNVMPNAYDAYTENLTDDKINPRLSCKTAYAPKEQKS